jgi:hypothetical protein
MPRGCTHGGGQTEMKRNNPMKLNLMNSLRRMSFVAGMAIVTNGLYAEDAILHVNVPFAFTVGTEAMPAGHYTVSRLNTLSGALLVRSDDGKASTIALTTPAASLNKPATLVFSSIDNGQALTMIRSAEWSATLPAPAVLPRPIARATTVPGVVASVARK